MKKGQASRTSGIVSGMLLASGDVDIELITCHVNKIIAQNKVSEDWDTSAIVHYFKNKGG